MEKQGNKIFFKCVIILGDFVNFFNCFFLEVCYVKGRRKTFFMNIIIERF